MKKHLVFIVALLSLFFTIRAGAQTTEISQQEAFNRVSKLFEGRDVDYYSATLKTTGDSNSWTFFVDANPMALWEHECYIVHFPKFSSENPASIQPESTQLSYPPSEYTRQPYLVKNRMDDDAAFKPYVEVSPQSRSDNFLGIKGRTYAIILSGVHDIDFNTLHFWNNCSFIYQTLRRRYSIPKENISVLMSDGTSPGIDMYNNKKNEYESSKLDLDEDGVPDIQYAATTNNLRQVINEIKDKINFNDHLFIFITNHGSHDGSMSYISMYSGGSLPVKSLTDMLMPLADSGVNVNMVIGCCHSGGIIKYLNRDNFVVATASSEYGYAYSSNSGYYGIFLQHWTAAVNKANFKGKKVNADTNGDGVISMHEAYTYAQEKTKQELRNQYSQFPDYLSIPEKLGDDLALNRLPAKDFDLFIRDNENDSRLEPNTTTDIFWNSPDIWIRNKNDNGTEHENPYYSPSHSTAYVNVRVNNNSGQAYTGGKSLKLYWAQASTSIDPNTWNGKSRYREEATGGLIATKPIEQIGPSSSKVIPVAWRMPYELFEIADRPEEHHFSIFAQIVDDSEAGITSDNFNALSSRRMAQTNVSIVTMKDSVYTSSVFFYNANAQPEITKYDLELRFRTEKDKELFKYAQFVIDMSPTIYYSWDYRGGKKSSAVVDNNYSPYSVELLEPTSKLSNICMVPYGIGRLNLHFNFFNAPPYSETYTFDLIQRDSQGTLIGGETFAIKTPRIEFNPIPVDSIKIDDGIIDINPDPDPFIKITANWYNADNKKIGTGQTLRVTPDMRGQEYRLVTITPEGELSRNDIYLENNTGIKQVQTYGSASEFIDIEMFDNALSSCSITVTSLTNGQIYYSRNLNPSDTTLRIDTSAMPRGHYVVTCSWQDKVISSHKFSKE